MSYPNELTFGVFDAATSEQLVSNPILWVWQVHAKAGKVFASLIDGGSVLNDKGDNVRFLLRSMGPRPDVVVGGDTLQRGDVVQLLDYTWRRVAGKTEIIFVILKMAIVSRAYSAKIENVPRTNLFPYPHDRAAAARKHSNPLEQGTALSDTTPSAPLPAFNIRNRPLYPNLDSQPPMHAVNTNLGGNFRPNDDSYPTAETSGELSRRQQDSGNSVASDDRPCAPSGEFVGPFPGDTKSSVRVAPYPPQYRQSGPIARRIDGQFLEIKNLTSFLGRWVVKGRFINKGEPRTYSNQRGEGKLWSCELVDGPSEESTIRCTFFNKAVDIFYPVIKENHVYTVSHGTLKPANRKFNSGAHPFELHLGEDADIQWVASDDPTIPLKPQAPVTPIAELAALPKQTSVSICGVLLHVSDLSEVITRSTGQPRAKREFSVLDDSNVAIDVTLWGSKAHLLDNVVASDHPVLLIERARVDEYNGRKLSSVAQTLIEVNPNRPEAARLKRWFADQQHSSYTSLTTASWANESRPTERVSIAELRQRALAASETELEDRGCWFSCQATLVTIDRDRQFYWVACPNCGRKVMPSAGSEFDISGAPLDPLTPYSNASETYVCSGCAKQVDAPVRKYLLSIEIADITGSLRCTALGDKGHLIMGSVTADTLARLQTEAYNPSVQQRYEDFFTQRLQKEYIFKIQAKSETYRDETRVRYRIFSVEPVNAVLESDTSQGPNGKSTCRAIMLREAKRALSTIYAYIPRVSGASVADFH